MGFPAYAFSNQSLRMGAHVCALPGRVLLPVAINDDRVSIAPSAMCPSTSLLGSGVMKPADALTLLRSHLARSENSDLSAWSTAEALLILDRLASSLLWTSADRHELAVLLAPTGALQEIAITNGWHDDYMICASSLDPR
jgi:hypothetical protein